MTANAEVELLVQWADMDAFGHVNNARFLTWFESARIALFQRIGVATSPAAVGPILATTTCDFLKPVVYPAKIRATASLTKIGESSMTMAYVVTDVESGAIHARGSSVAVLVDFRTGQKVRVPDDVRLHLTDARAP